MSEDRPTIAEIEAELERERQALAAKLAELQDRLSPGGILHEALGLFDGPKSGAAVLEALGAVSGAIRSNPLASLAAGAGLAWLASRPSRRGRAPRTEAAQASAVGTTVAAASAMANVVAAMEPEEIRAVAAEADRIYRAGAARLREIDEALRQRAGGLAESASNTSQQAQDFAAEKARIAGEVAAEVKARLARGLEGVSEEATAAIVTARERAYEALRKTGAKVDTAHDEVANLVDRHPVAVGAAAAAAGALIAVALGAASGGGDKKRNG